MPKIIAEEERLKPGHYVRFTDEQMRLIDNEVHTKKLKGPAELIRKIIDQYFKS